MQLLDKKKLEALKKEFESFPEGLELSTFIWLMLCVLEFKEDEKFEIVQGLTQLFSEVDINDDKHMEWSEFTQYIIDSVMIRKAGKDELKRGKSKKNDGNRSQDITQQNVTNNQSFEIQMPNGGGDPDFDEEEDFTTENEDDEEALNGQGNKGKKQKSKAHIILSQSQYRHFDHSLTQFDHVTHSSEIKQSLYSEKLNGFLTIENLQREIKIYTKDGYQKDKIPLNTNKTKIFTMAMTFSDKHSLLACLTSDCHIEIFDYTNPAFFRFMRAIQTPCIQNGIWYLPNHDIWLSAGKDYKVHQWNVSKFEEIEQQSNFHMFSFGGHTDQIMDLVEIKIPNFCIATASLDRTIRLYNISERFLITVLKGHETGIRKLSYISNFGGFFISVGHEQSIYVWSPETAQNKPFVGKLKGHSEPVVDAKFFPKTTLIVSIDEKLMIKIFDVYTFECKQTIFPQQGNKPPVNGLLLLPNTSDIFIWFGKRFIFFDTSMQEQQQRKFYKDEIYPMKVFMNQYNMSFYVVTKHDVRILDAKTGLLIKVLDQIVDHENGIEIIDFTFDDTQRKFYVGDTSGNLKCFNAGNCLLIKEESIRTPHQANEKKAHDLGIQEYYRNQTLKNDISEIVFEKVAGEKILFAIDNNKNLISYDEENNEEFQFLRMAFNNQQIDITCFQVSSYHSLIATGSSTGLINTKPILPQLRQAKDRKVFVKTDDIDKYIEQTIPKAHSKPINFLQFNNDINSIITASSDGFFKIWNSQDLNLLCQVDIHSMKKRPSIWNLPIDWHGRKREELLKIKQILEIIEPGRDQNQLYQKMIEKNKLKIERSQDSSKLIGGLPGISNSAQELLKKLEMSFKKSLLKSKRRPVNDDKNLNAKKKILGYNALNDPNNGIDDDLNNENQEDFKKKIDAIFKHETPTYQGFAKDLQRQLNHLYKEKVERKKQNSESFTDLFARTKRVKLFRGFSTIIQPQRLQDQQDISKHNAQTLTNFKWIIRHQTEKLNVEKYSYTFKFHSNFDTQINKTRYFRQQRISNVTQIVNIPESEQVTRLLQEWSESKITQQQRLTNKFKAKNRHTKLLQESVFVRFSTQN
eukprot:403362615